MEERFCCLCGHKLVEFLVTGGNALSKNTILVCCVNPKCVLSGTYEGDLK